MGRQTLLPDEPELSIVVTQRRCSTHADWRFRLSLPLPPWKGKKDREDEHNDHGDDDDEIRHGHLNEAPVDVVARPVEVDESSDQH